MYRSFPFLLVPLLLAACASPQERCLREARAEPRRIAAEIIDTELALSRGYRLVTLRDRRMALTTCVARRADGATYGYGCYRPVSETRQEPVGIDYSEERARLDRLRAAYGDAQAQADRRAALCPVPIGG